MTASLALMLPYQITSFDVHERLFGIWQRVAPRLLPTHASQTEPVRTPFDPTNLPRDPYLWGGYSWLAVRKKPGVEAHFLDGLHHQSSIHIEVTLAVGAGPDLVRDLGLALAAELQPDFGLVHTLTRAEADEARPVRRPDVLTINRVTGEFFLSGAHSRQLANGMPTLYWVTIFGEPYRKILSDRLAGLTAAHDVSETGNATIVQLTPDAPDEASYPTFAAVRGAAMESLGRDLFWPSASLVPPEISSPRPTPSWSAFQT